MALGRGDAQQRRAHTVDNDGEQRRAQRDQRGVRVAAEIDHVADSGRHRGVQPFTKMTPSVSNVVMASAGFEHTCWMKYENDTSKRVITFFFEGPSCGGSHSADVLIIYGDDYVVWIYPSCHDDLSVCRR